MSNSQDTYFLQQKILKTKKKSIITGMVDGGLVKTMLESEVTNSLSMNFSLISEITNSEGVNEREVHELLISLKDRFRDDRLQTMVDQLQNDVIKAVVVPFGLGKVLAAYDKAGGNITTLHNFENGVVATADDRDKYNEWQDVKKNGLDRKGKHKPHDDVKNAWKKDQFQRMNSGDEIKDGYTGKVLGVKNGDTIYKFVSIDADHITSISEYENDPVHHLFAKGNSPDERVVSRSKVTGNKANLTLTDGGLNNSKKDKDLKDWEGGKVSKKHAEETGNPDMTNGEYYNTNTGYTDSKKDESDGMINKDDRIRKIYKYSKDGLITSGTEALKMGWKQAFGMVLIELFSGIIQEIRIIFKEGIDKDRWLSDIEDRFNLVAGRVLEKWKDVLVSFSDGAISGFLSNIVTTLINTFVTTAKRAVRMIREGVVSVYGAMKMLAFHPDGMSFSEVAHEAMKVIFSGGIVVGGAVLEDVINKAIMTVPLLAPISEILTALIVGSLTAITMALTAYIWDKLDFFGAIKGKEDAYVLNQLEASIESNHRDIDYMLEGYSW